MNTGRQFLSILLTIFNAPQYSEDKEKVSKCNYEIRNFTRFVEVLKCVAQLKTIKDTKMIVMLKYGNSYSPYLNHPMKR